MITRPTSVTGTDTLFPDTTLFRSRQIPEEPGSESKARQPRGKRYARVDTACGKIGEEQAARRCGNHDDQQGAGIDGAIALKSGKKLGNDEYRKERAEAEKRSEEHTSGLQSLMRNSYAVFCLKKHSLRVSNR